MSEVWRDVPGFEGRYQASSWGRVRSLDRTVWQTNRWGQRMPRIERGKILTSRRDRDGYLRTFSREIRESAVHRIVALAFTPNLGNLPQINHKNGVKDDNRPSNPEWCDNTHNHLHRVHVLGGHLPQPITRRTQVKRPDGKVEVYESASVAARALGVVKTAVMNAIARGGKCLGCEVQYV